MRVVGLVAAKANSNRFPGKNLHLVEGVPMFMHSVEPLLASKHIEKVYILTDSVEIAEYCRARNIDIIWRPKNATRDEDKLISVLRFGYYNLDNEYDIVVSVMANCPGYTSSDIDNGIDLLISNKLKEVRGYDHSGVENGLLVLDKSILQSNQDISYYVGAVQTSAKEIHYKEDLN